MREISADEANSQFQISTVHHEMSPGGELRFRLCAADGTRYIRTVRPLASGGEWQDAHFHRSVLETYIVQAGWIAFVERQGDEPMIRRLGPGEIVTTQPGVHHNVYMSAGAVIHTVKHGVADGEDKEPAPDLTIWCKRLTGESQILAQVAASRPRNSAALESVKARRPVYDEAYRHFDSLIWQMPGWSTAVFLGMAAVLGQASPDNLEKLLPVFTSKSLSSGFLFVVFCFMFGLTQALYRFRVHQIPMKAYKRTPFWSSASTLLQIFVTVQAFIVFYLALGTAGVTLSTAFVGSALICMCVVTYREWRIRRPSSAPELA